MNAESTTDRESPNPYASPREVATGDVDQNRREVGQRVIDLHHQTIGFWMLGGTGVVAMMVAAGAVLLANKLPLAAKWDWADDVLRIGGFLLGVASAPTSAICLIWGCVSRVQWFVAKKRLSLYEQEGAS